MKIVIAHQTIVDGDAIGHDIQGMYHALKRSGYEVYIYGEYNYLDSSEYRHATLDQLISLVLDGDNLFIYHHSNYWQRGEKLLDIADCRVVIRYHNITPSRFFKPYSDHYYSILQQAEKQTDRLVKQKDFLWLGDSQYNCREVVTKGVATSRSVVLPPFHNIERMERVVPDHETLENLLDGDRVNVLFISRMAPNKGHKAIVQTAAAYKRMFGDQVRFWVVGDTDKQLKRYNTEMSLWIKKYGLQELVVLTGKVSRSSLKAYFMGSRVFLCLSEHEGFGVPLIEAQYYRLPVVACDAAAIKETLGVNQLIFDRFDEELVASAIHAVATQEQLAHSLGDQGWSNYQSRFAPQVIEKRFLDIIQSLRNGR